MKDYFISYAKEDSVFAKEFYSDLGSDDTSVWFADKSIDAGSEWPEEVKKGIRECETVIVILSPDACESQYVLDEIDYAKKLKKKIIPVILRKVKEIPFGLGRYQFVDISSRKRKEYTALIAALSKGSIEHSSEDEVLPYKRWDVLKLSMYFSLIVFVFGIVSSISACNDAHESISSIKNGVQQSHNIKESLKIEIVPYIENKGFSVAVIGYLFNIALIISFLAISQFEILGRHLPSGLIAREVFGQFERGWMKIWILWLFLYSTFLVFAGSNYFIDQKLEKTGYSIYELNVSMMPDSLQKKLPDSLYAKFSGIEKKMLILQGEDSFIEQLKSEMTLDLDSLYGNDDVKQALGVLADNSRRKLTIRRSVTGSFVDFFNILSSYAFLWCFLVLYHPSVSTKEEEDRSKVFENSAAIFIVISILFLTLTVYDRISYDEFFGLSVKLDGLGLILGAGFAGIAMIFFFGRLDSFLIAMPRTMLFVLYAYALLQLPYASLDNVLGQEWREMLFYGSIFFLKLMLLIAVEYILKNPNMANYLDNTEELTGKRDSLKLKLRLKI